MKSINKILLTVAAAALGLTGTVSCDNDKMYDMDHQEATIIGELSFNFEGSLIMPLGADLQLEVSIAPEEAINEGYIFRTSDADVAYIDDEGMLHCVGLGIARVSAVPSIGFGATASLEITVVENVVYSQSMTIEGVKELAEYHYLGDEFQLQPVILPEDHTYSYVDWSSSDPEVMSVDEDGNVVCGKEGTATITAVTKAPDTAGITGSITLTVSPSADVEEVQIAPYTDPICLEKPFELDVTYLPSYANPSTVEWTSSDESVAVASKGRVVPTGFGTCTLTAICPNGKTANVTITVTPGWHIWDPENKFVGWVPATTGSTFEYLDDYILDHMAISGSNYRADIRYACDANSPLVLNFGEYPVIAVRATIPDGGRNTWDVVDVAGTGGGNPQCNFGRYATGNPIRLDDGSALFYVDWSSRTQYPLNGNIGFKTFQLKIADMVIADTPTDSFKMYWIRTFKSVADMQEFAEQEVAAGK
ncbi:MAG: DUF4979 domain-containing protein [Muribaculaceae bacterium]|nr:DUF4979 domain-containing protein [Muribaculaceae bacterium]